MPAFQALVIVQHSLIDLRANRCTSYRSGGATYEPSEDGSGNTAQGNADRAGKSTESRASLGTY